MSERYIVTSRSGEQVVRTDDAADADQWRELLHGEVIDQGVAA